MLLLVYSMVTVRTRFYLLRSDIIPANQSSWQWLFAHGQDDAFMSCMAVTREAFGILLHAFAPLFKPAGENGGRKSLLGPAGALGLALHHLSSTTGQSHLCLIFGVTPSTLSATLSRALRALARLTLHEARVEWPDTAQKRHFSDMISAKFPSLRNVYAFVDGTLVRIQCYSDEIEQNTHYSGRKKIVCINNCLVWPPEAAYATACSITQDVRTISPSAGL